MFHGLRSLHLSGELLACQMMKSYKGAQHDVCGTLKIDYDKIQHLLAFT